MNECQSNPCTNGYCADAVNGYICHCHPGRTGKHCEIGIYADPLHFRMAISQLCMYLRFVYKLTRNL